MFNVKTVTNEIVKFIRDYFRENNLKGVVLGISGGKDSAVVSGLFCRALGKGNVIGVTLPCHSKEKDKIDAQIVSNYFGFRLLNLNLDKTFDMFTNEFNINFQHLGFSDENLRESNLNLKPRLRMAALYYIARAVSKLEVGTYIVAGTSNLSEIYVGYFTKGGDNVCDISVLANLTVEEVIKIGDYIGVPKEILYKAPSDGLSNLTDEEKLGVKYSDIFKVINGEEVELEILEKINNLHQRSKHKFIVPTYMKK